MKQVADPAVSTLLNTTIVGQPWHDDYRPGLGVDAVTGQVRARAVADFEVQDTPILSPMYTYSLVQSESDMSSMISASAQGSYNMEGVTVGAGTSYLESLAVSELSVTLVAEVSVNRSQYSLAPQGDYRLAVEPGPDFRDKYGDYFVAGYRSSSQLHAMYQCTFSSVEERRKFTATLSAEVPQVFTAQGSTAFEKARSECHASVNVIVSADGVKTNIPTPADGWTPATILSVLLPWFNENMAPKPLEAYLMHYRVIDPAISGEVPVSPDVFAQLAFLYDRFWLARARFHTCPAFGRPLVDEPYKQLEKKIEAYQATLPHDEAQIEQLTSDTNELLGTFTGILNRQTFFSQVMESAKSEPARDQNFDADKGTVRWNYGFNNSNLPGVSVASASDHVEQDWKIGWREHTFNFRDSTKVLVGWDVICNWTDGTGGDWHKACDQVIGRGAADVYVKSDYDRGYSWSIVWYFVEATLYPTPRGQ